MEITNTVPSRSFRQGDNSLHTRIKGHVMLKQKKFRQATLIVIATAVILILPNLTRIFS
jgi:hypothetical protein